MSDYHLHSRKQLLLARCNLQRLQVSHHSLQLRRSLTTPRTAFAIASSPPGRSLLLGMLTLALGRTRVAGFLRVALAGLGIARTLGAAAAWMSQRAPSSAPSQEEKNP
jgi:hypothetical protein